MCKQFSEALAALRNERLANPKCSKCVGEFDWVQTSQDQAWLALSLRCIAEVTDLLVDCSPAFAAVLASLPGTVAGKRNRSAMPALLQSLPGSLADACRRLLVLSDNLQALEQLLCSDSGCLCHVNAFANVKLRVIDLWQLLLAALSLTNGAHVAWSQMRCNPCFQVPATSSWFAKLSLPPWWKGRSEGFGNSNWSKYVEVHVADARLRLLMLWNMVQTASHSMCLILLLPSVR